MMTALDAGAEDMTVDEAASIICAPGDLEAVRAALLDAGYDVTAAEVNMIPLNTIEITDVETAAKLMKLIEALEDNDDVREVYANYAISDEIMEQL